MTEITPSLIYWITRLDQFNALTGCASLFIFIIAIVLMIAVFVEAESNNEKSYRIVLKGFKISLFVLAIFSLMHTFIPTTKEACAMYVVPKIVNNEKVQNVSKEFYDLALEWMKELRPKSIQNKEKSK